MESSITPERIANAIMQDSRFCGQYLIVEGKKDSKVYGKFLDKDTIRIKEAFGFLKVLKVLEILFERGFDRQVGIIDSDFSSIMERTLPQVEVFVTDDHDIEMTIIKTEALESVVEALLGKESITEFCNKYGPLRQVLFDSCIDLAYLKLANATDNLGLVFKPKGQDGNPIKYKNFICNKTLSYLGRELLVDTVINYSRNRSATISDKAEILISIEKVSKNKYDVYHLINGHDVCNAIFIMLKYVLKSRNPILFDYNAVEEMLAMAFDFSFFSKTKLYQALISWANAQSIKIIKSCYLEPPQAVGE